MQTYRAREAAARERRIREAERLAAERLRTEPGRGTGYVADESARRRREAGEARGTTAPSNPGGQTLLQRLLDADGMNMCSLNLQGRQRILYGEGALSRWTATGLAERFPRKRSTGSVTTYVGDAIQFRDADGSWLNATYECDYDHDASEVVDVRAVPGALR